MDTARRPVLLRRRRVRSRRCAVFTTFVLLVWLSLLPGAGATYSAKTVDTGNAWSAAAKFASCQNVAASDGAYTVFPLSDSSGVTAADSTGNGYPGTYQGGVTLAQAGPCPADGAKSVTLNGSTGYVSTSRQVPNPQVFTIEVWFKTTTTRGGGLVAFAGNQTGSPQGWDRQIYMTNSGALGFGVACSTGSGDCYAFTSTTYNDGVWHLATATLSSAGQRLYVDGVQKASDPNAADGVTYAGYWRVGHTRTDDAPSPSTSQFFAGSLAFASFYSTALSAAQIAHHYAAGS